jgi:hypothetical protein
MVFDLNYLKEIVRDTLRVYLYPNNMKSDTALDLTNIDKVSQSFIPYSKCYTTLTPYKYNLPIDVRLKKTGNPDDNIIISMESNLNDEPSGTTVGSYTLRASDISNTFDVYSGTIKLTSMIGSNTKYWLSIDPLNSRSTIDFYSIEKSNSDTYLIGTLKTYDGTIWTGIEGDMNFNIEIPNWIFNDYPRTDISKWSFPRIAIDMISRKVEQRWIRAEIADYYIDFNVIAYSNYADELDDILSFVDRTIFKERTKFSGVQRIDTGDLTPVEVLRDNLFSRAIKYSMVYRMTNV